jgi:4-hydroxythreonine-4-phosphate dehydrogenase
MKPVVLLSAGDPLGIGPEIVVKALKHPLVKRACRAVVIGEPSSLLRAGFSTDLAPLITLETPVALNLRRPQPTKAGGLVSFRAVELGIKLALHYGAPLVTAPISKQSWALNHIPFTGHTELLRARTGQDGLMMFVSGNLRCALASEHFALADLPRVLTKTRVEKSLLHFARALKNFGTKKPQIALCALNPHASDNGKFGTEENRLLTPVVRALTQKGFRIDGPLPTDTAWLRHTRGQYDGLLCLYHDQALTPLKLAARAPIVHLTAGLPFLRTSPAHGTAFDIAGQNKADPASMIAAILFAARKGA